MPLKVFAAKYRWNPKEEEWILKNDKDDHYYNNSALKNAWSSLSYPIRDGDYYFAFIHDNPRINAQYNAQANRELQKYKKSFLNPEEIYDKMHDYFKRFKDAGSGDTMTREELWTAVVDMRKKNPAPKKPTNESLDENYRKLAKKRMGAETRNSIKVGRIVDFYDNNGNKREGKIIKIGQIGDGYTLKDTKDNKVYKFKFYDKMKAKKLLAANVESNLQEVSLNNNMMQRHFANVWATKDAKIYRVLAQLVNQDGFVDNRKAYEKNPKDYLNRLRDIAKNPKKYEKSFGRNFAQYINNPKPGQNYAKLPESLEEQGMGDKIGKLFKTKDKKEIDGIANLLNMTSVKVLQSMMKQNPQGFKRMAKKMGELPAMEEKEILDSFELNEVTDKEINMAKKLSKDMEKVKKGYQQIAKSGDKTLKNTGFNPTYEAILKAQQKVLSLIGELTTMKQMSDRSASRKKDAQGRPIMSSNIMDSYREMREDELKEESITYQLKIKNKNGPEYKKFEKSARMMKLKMSSKMNAGDKLVAVLNGTKKNLRDFDAVVRGRQSYGDPSTVKHFDEK